MTWFNNLKLSHRIYLAFFAVIAIIMVMGISAITTIRSLDHDFIEFAEHGEALQASAATTRSFLAMNSLALKYVASSDEDILKKAETAHKQVLQLIDEELPRIHIPEDKAKLEEVRHLIEEYWTGFVKLADDRHKQAELVENDLHATGDALQQEFQEIYEHVRHEEVEASTPQKTLPVIVDALTHLLIARDHANRFVYSGNIADLDRAFYDMDKVKKDLVAKEIKDLGEKDQVLVAKALDQVKIYRHALEEFVELDKEVAQLQHDVMEKATTTILADLKDIEDLAIETEHKIGEHVHSEAGTAVFATAIELIIAVLLAVALSFGLGRAISLPIQQLSRIMRAMSAGDLDQKIPDARGKDEIGEMTDALKVFHEGMAARLELQAEQVRDRDRKTRRQDEINQLVGIFGSTIRGVFQRVSSSSEDMSKTASLLFDNSESTSEQTNLLNREANETANVVTTVSSAAEELSASISEIQRRVDHSSSISDQAIERAKVTSASFSELLEAAKQITSVVELINEIAEQTNLLALNATIEAARAGEAGRGFAIVANEVKELATQTAKATGEISGQVNAVQRTAKEAEDSMESINTTIGEIHEVAASIAEAVRQQHIATTEIAQSVEVVASSARSVGGSVDVVSGFAEQGRDGARIVRDGADVVAGEATLLSSEVESFLLALSDNGDEDTFQILSVDLPTEIDIDGKTHMARVRTISTAAATIDVPIPADPGSALTIRIDGLGFAIAARLAATEGSTSQIQFPLNHEHVEKMRDRLATLGIQQAA